MIRYEPGRDADLAVAAWWVKMERDGDLPALFAADYQTLGALYKLIRPPNAALFEVDATGIWLAMWFEQVMGTLFAGVWIARERRHTRPALRALLHGYGQALALVPAIMGVTKQERLLAPHRRLGYQVLGEVPGLWDGERAWIVMLTRPALASTLERYGLIHAELDAVMAREEAMAHG